MTRTFSPWLILLTSASTLLTAASSGQDFSPPPEERQLPKQMRSAMKVLPSILKGCTVRNYNGDGVSFQQSNDVTVEECRSENNASLGIHPGSGSQRPTVRNCVARGNGEDGLFLCWRVRHGLFEDNVLENNSRYGISIGHKDSDNLLRHNQVRSNQAEGVYFRNEPQASAGHRNVLQGNFIENNGAKAEVAGIRVRGETRDIVLKNNTIRDTRPEESRRQTTGIQIESKAGPVVLESNLITAPVPVKDQRTR